VALVELLQRPGGAVGVDPKDGLDVPLGHRDGAERAQVGPERAAGFLERGGGARGGIQPQRGRRPDADEPTADANRHAAFQAGAQLALEHRLRLRCAQAPDLDAGHADAGQHVLLVLPPADADRRCGTAEHGDEQDRERAEAQTPAATAEHALH
jgi:hypothetical protein